MSDEYCCSCSQCMGLDDDTAYLPVCPDCGCTPEFCDCDDREEYEHSHGTCETCGGEYGPGWSSCTCDLDDEDSSPDIPF